MRRRERAHSPLALKYFNKVQTAACCSSSISLGSRCMRRISDGFLPSVRGRAEAAAGGRASRGWGGAASNSFIGECAKAGLAAFLRGVREPRLPALKNAAAYFHASIIRGVEKERHALLDDRVRSRERLSERLVEMGRRGGFQIDCEHRRIFMSEQSPGASRANCPVPCAFTSPLRRSVGRPSSSMRPRKRSACMS